MGAVLKVDFATGEYEQIKALSVSSKYGKNKKKGKSATVYPIKNSEELKRFINYFTEQIEAADTKYRKFVAYRNNMLIQIGLNTAYRISDIVNLQWRDVFATDGKFKDGNTKTEIKTGKRRLVYMEEQAQKAINLFLENTNVEPAPDNYLFTTCKTGKMSEQNAYTLIKNVAKEVGIRVNIGTHTMRKTFVYWSLMAHKGDAMFLTKIQQLLRHSSPAITLRYAGIEDDETKGIYEDIGSLYKSILDDDYRKRTENKISISRDRLMEIVKMAYQIGSEDGNEDVSAQIDNMETIAEMIDEYTL